jgi:hypothetical protein
MTNAAAIAAARFANAYAAAFGDKPQTAYRVCAAWTRVSFDARCEVASERARVKYARGEYCETQAAAALASAMEIHAAAKAEAKAAKAAYRADAEYRRLTR